MPKKSSGLRDPSRRGLMASGAALLGAAKLLPDVIPSAQAAEVTRARQPAAIVAPNTPPGGYNILFILVDQEHFFDDWPIPVPGREWIKQNGITFTNHQAASCVCSPARSTIYTGQHSSILASLITRVRFGSPTWRRRFKPSATAWRHSAITPPIKASGT
jgi:hypothetical protein